MAVLEIERERTEDTLQKKRLMSLAPSLIGAVIVLGFIYYLYRHAGEYLRLLDLSGTGLALLFAFSALNPILNGLQNTILYRSLGTSDFSQADGFFITAAATLANQLPIPGGIVSKGLYLKRKYNLSYATFTTSTLALFVCFLALDGLIGLGILLYLALGKGIVASLPLWVGFSLMLASLVIFWLPVHWIDRVPYVNRWSHQSLEGWLIISRAQLMVVKTLLLQLILIALSAARYWIAFHMFSQDVSATDVLLMSNASILTQIVSIAPGGLGVREAIVGSVAALLGFDAAVSVAAVALDRLIATMVTLLLGGTSAVILARQIARIAPTAVDGRS